jgi:hypothetical protein
VSWYWFLNTDSAPLDDVTGEQDAAVELRLRVRRRGDHQRQRQR